jgi:hypothetical protein
MEVEFFRKIPLPQGEQFKRVTTAAAERKRRREEWLKERREELRERSRAFVIEKALKRQTERCAAKRSGDPTLALGRRFQAKIHADSRKVGVIALRNSDPIRERLPSISAIPAISELKLMPNSGLFNWSELQTEKTAKWFYKGQNYTQEELSKHLGYERKIQENSQTRLKGRKTFQKSMADLQSSLQASVIARQKGIAASVIPEFRIAPVSNTLSKSRQKSVHEWKMSEEAVRRAELDKAAGRRPSVQIQSLTQLIGFASDDTNDNVDDTMEMEWEKIDIIVDDENFQMPCLEDYNATPVDRLTQSLKGMSLNLLKKLKDHLMAKGKESGIRTEQTKWQALLTAISEAHKNPNKKNNNSNNNQNSSKHPACTKCGKNHAGGAAQCRSGNNNNGSNQSQNKIFCTKCQRNHVGGAAQCWSENNNRSGNSNNNNRNNGQNQNKAPIHCTTCNKMHPGGAANCYSNGGNNSNGNKNGRNQMNGRRARGRDRGRGGRGRGRGR